ncbi:tektin-3-like [Amphibalanus amphitrite]|uniref:tektin-3-like n=1 Tax=Amphibalanus amphitrite TaxID=1232801 RepID=UPI001C9230EE|nr:tektin-3-like [Amphibalanus amphitrite]
MSALFHHTSDVTGGCQCCRSAGGGRPANLDFPSLPLVAGTAPLSQYTVADWHQTNHDNLTTCDRQRAAGAQARCAAQRAIRDADRAAAQAQRESTQRLAERAGAVGRWRHEVLHELELNSQETERLEEARRRAECLHNELAAPLRLAEDNRRARQLRTGPDLVHDPVEAGLEREAGVLVAMRERLCRTLDHVSGSLQELRETRRQLERDASDKFAALHLDRNAHGLGNASPGTALYPGIERWDRTQSNPDSWEEHTRRLVQQSQTARANSAAVRAEVESVTHGAVSEHWQAWTSTNQALAARAQQTQEARNRIQQELSRLTQEIAEQERHRAALRRALAAQTPHLRVAHTRLERRTHRPGLELCRDPAMDRLQGEVREIGDSVHVLQRQLSELETALAGLLQQKAKMEDELRVKANSLLIDRDQVLGSRRAFPVTSIVTKCL